MSEQKDQTEAACGGSALTAELGANERERDAAWISLVMNAAAEIEDAANCLRDSDAKRVAHSAAKHYRDAANALWIAAVPNVESEGAAAALSRTLPLDCRVRPRPPTKKGIERVDSDDDAGRIQART